MSIVIEHVNQLYMPGTDMACAALSDITLTINEGEFLGVIGHTGSGKSTLVQHIGGIMQPSSGRIIVDGFNLADKKQRQEGRRRVGLVFQYPEYQLFEETVKKDIAYGPKNMKLDPEEIEARVKDAMRLVGLPYDAFAEKSPFELSGGEKRRAALAGVIAMRPKYLVLDEPMAGLDPSGRKAILNTVDSLREETGCAVIMVSHSMDDVACRSDRVAVLSEGKLLKVGTPREIFGESDTLSDIGLDLPEVSKLARKLRERGMQVPPVYEMEEMVAFLLGRVKHV